MQVRRVAVALVMSIVLAVGATACDPTLKVSARGGTGQIIVETAPNALIALYDANGKLVPTLKLGDTGDPVPTDFQRTDANGYLVLRYVTPASGYTVRRVDSTKTKPSDPVTVTKLLSAPPTTLYTGQKLVNGFEYLKTRDGTLLSVMVRLPGPADKGPYPTIVEYSGYDPANPEFGGTSAASRITNALGYATVGVNIRGTGCSGGSFQLWEDAAGGRRLRRGRDHRRPALGQEPQGRSWSASRTPATPPLYAAATQPPSLAGIAVGGTYDDGFRNLLRPSGIVNSGFAKEWIKGREAEAEPGGQAWTQKRIDEGDAICAFNQRLRSQNVDLANRIDIEPVLPRDVRTWVTRSPRTPS